MREYPSFFFFSRVSVFVSNQKAASQGIEKGFFPYAAADTSDAAGGKATTDNLRGGANVYLASHLMKGEERGVKLCQTRQFPPSGAQE